MTVRDRTAAVFRRQRDCCEARNGDQGEPGIAESPGEVTRVGVTDEFLRVGARLTFETGRERIGQVGERTVTGVEHAISPFEGAKPLGGGFLFLGRIACAAVDGSLISRSLDHIGLGGEHEIIRKKIAEHS